MPRRTAVVTDSTADLSPTQQASFDIRVVPLNVHIGQESWRDRIDLSADQFMEKLDAARTLPTTSHPSVGAFEQVFRDVAKTHDAIVCPVISSRLSGTFQSANLAASAVIDEIAVSVVDSLNVTAALGMQAMNAARMANDGMGAEEIANILRLEADRYQNVFFVETLGHLRRGGRIGKAAQMLGSMLQLKPLLRIEEGQIVPFERTRTRSRAISALVEFANDAGQIDEATVFYNTTPDDASGLANTIAAITGLESVPFIQVAPVISAHIGPGILGVSLKEAPNG